MSNKAKLSILFSICITAVASMVIVGPVQQKTDYHLFADQRSMYSVPNFYNVVTNLPFCVIGLLGVLAVNKGRPNLKSSYFVFFIGIFFTGIGSAYYHWNPNSETLVGDRLPLTIAFMGFFSFLIGNNILVSAGKQILWPLVAIGFMSIITWAFNGDLRLYILVQFLPIILMPFILLFYRSQFIDPIFLWGVILSYALAKICETYDKQIFGALEFSGHSLKHLFAALAPLSLLLGVWKFRA